jgi:predicted HTH domain antitoxin
MIEVLYFRSMTLQLPDNPAFEEAELRLELACALYARGKIGKVSAAEFAGVDFFTFQRALGERRISFYSEEMLREDVSNVAELRRQ